MEASRQPIHGANMTYGVGDVPVPIMRYRLMQLLKIGDDLAVSERQWEQLSRTHPNFRDFISVLSYQVAPDDAELRARVLAALLNLFFLTDHSVAVKQLSTLFETKPHARRLRAKKSSRPNGGDGGVIRQP